MSVGPAGDRRRPGPSGRFRALASVLVLLLPALLATGCSTGDRAVSGLVIDIEPAGPARIAGFTLRTETGQTMAFTIGDLDISSGGFDALHLTQHLATGQPIAVSYAVEDGVNVAHRLVDAPWVTP